MFISLCQIDVANSLVHSLKHYCMRGEVVLLFYLFFFLAFNKLHTITLYQFQIYVRIILFSYEGKFFYVMWVLSFFLKGRIDIDKWTGWSYLWSSIHALIFHYLCHTHTYTNPCINYVYLFPVYLLKIFCLFFWVAIWLKYAKKINTLITMMTFWDLFKFSKVKYDDCKRTREYARTMRFYFVFYVDCTPAVCLPRERTFVRHHY